MISYHIAINAQAFAYSGGFRTADCSDDADRISRGIAGFVWSPCVWRNGERRVDNFLRADWVALDFDDGEMTLVDAENSFCDMVHIIGTTRSHQIAKDGKPPVDRFRVVLRTERTITAAREYTATLKTLMKKYPCDPAPKDAGRFFFPCKEIVSVSGDGYRQEVFAPDPAEDANLMAQKSVERWRFEQFGSVPGWLKRFLEKGKPTRTGRNQTVYAAAVWLASVGVSEEQTIEALLRAPFDRTEFTERELISAVRSGRKREAR